MRLFTCAGRRFIAPTFVFYVILSGATVTPHTSHVHAMISPILSSLSSNPLLRRYPLAHVSCFSSRTLYALLMSCCISVLAKFVSCLPYNRRAIVHLRFFFSFHIQQQHSAPFRSTTEWSALQFDMFKRIMFDPKILCKLFSIMRGKQICHKRPELITCQSSVLPKTRKGGR